VQQHILEQDPAKMDQITSFVEQKSKERLNLLSQQRSMLTTARERELFDATREALAPYMVGRTQVVKLSANLKTKAEAAALLHEQLEPLYGKLQDAMSAEVDLNKANADEASRQIQEAVTSTRTAIWGGLLIGLIFTLIDGFLLVRAINRSLTRLVSAVEVTQSGNQRQLSTANEIAATTSEIGATSKQISVTSKELVHTMRLKTLGCLTVYEFICKCRRKEPHRFTLDPTHQLPGLNI
jgi:methyl-accepting chemotaxis protein WspA